MTSRISVPCKLIWNQKPTSAPEIIFLTSHLKKRCSDIPTDTPIDHLQKEIRVIDHLRSYMVRIECRETSSKRNNVRYTFCFRIHITLSILNCCRTRVAFVVAFSFYYNYYLEFSSPCNFPANVRAFKHLTYKTNSSGSFHTWLVYLPTLRIWT